MRLIQVAHTSERNTGVQPPQQVTAFNAYSEEQSILNANQSLVQQIVSSGLAAPGDTLAILGVLLASGQVSSSIFSNGVALFGGGLTSSGLSVGPVTANLNLNSSDSRELDEMQLDSVMARLGPYAQVPAIRYQHPPSQAFPQICPIFQVLRALEVQAVSPRCFLQSAEVCRMSPRWSIRTWDSP